MYIVLGAILALGAGGYYFLKPVRDVASTAREAINTVKGQAVSGRLFFLYPSLI